MVIATRCLHKFLFILILILFSVCSNSNTSCAIDLINDVGIPFLGTFIKTLPKPKFYGNTYTTDASPLSYRYVVFESGIRDSDLRVLEQMLSQKGYYVLGRNSSYNSPGTLRIRCRVDGNYDSNYSSKYKKIYKYSASCELADVNRNYFIVYSGQSELYGSGENERSRALALTLFRFNSSAQLHNTILFDVKGVDDGRRSIIQKDRDEAILDAKYQALAKLGSEMTNLEKYRLELSQGKITEDTYRQEIEERATGRFLSDCTIKELGYINGSYTVRFIGSVVPDPIGSIDTRAVPMARNKIYPSAQPINNFPEVSLALERIPTGTTANWRANGQQYNMRIIATYDANPKRPCRKYTIQVDNQRNISTYMACRNRYGAWENQ